MKVPRLLTLLAGATALASAIDPRGAVFALLLNCIALAALPSQVGRGPDRRARFELYTLLGALCLNLLSVGRFVVREAMPGISEARAREESARAVSRLREILFAEDALRRLAAIDPDGDGVGSAGLLGELSGTAPARGRSAILHPPLAERFAPRTGTSEGPALEEGGFLYIVCLPRAEGGYTARPSDPIDEERAERNWFAYAWPATDGGAITSTFFIDQHEAIRETRGNGPAPWAGPYRAPPCDAAIHPSSRDLFVPWRGKIPRTELPGDLSRGSSFRDGEPALPR